MDLAMQGCCPGVTLVTCHFVIGFSRLQTSSPYYPPELGWTGHEPAYSIERALESWSPVREKNSFPLTFIFQGLRLLQVS